jgi:hypothetical protein
MDMGNNAAADIALRFLWRKCEHESNKRQKTYPHDSGTRAQDDGHAQDADRGNKRKDETRYHMPKDRKRGGMGG